MRHARVARIAGLITALASMLFTSCAIPGSRPRGMAASLLLHGGEIWTGDPALPEAEAMAILGPYIVAVGGNREVLAHRGPATRVVDLGGRRVIPGFIDSHVHLLSGGDELLAPDLRSAGSEEEFASRLSRVAADLPVGMWISSGSWDHENWPGGRLPGRATLDRYVPEHPVFVSRIDGHMAVANSLALRMAGVSRETSDPEGGEIVRDGATGEPTGVLKAAAMDLVARQIPPWTTDQRLDRARAALRHAARLGVTGVHDMLGSFTALETYQELRRRDELTVRVTILTPIASHGRWASVRVRQGLGDRFLRINGLKGFADGSLGSSTALFIEPYTGLTDHRGLALADLSPGGELEKQVAACTREGLQVAVHGIGDRAIRSLLDIYERVGGGHAREKRFRIEHSQHIHPADLDRFAMIGVIASMQPYHAIDDGRWAAKRIGEKRCGTSYAFRDLLDRGASLAFGSDWPVAPLSPLRGVHAAVTRATLDGKHPGGWVPRQKIRVEEALLAYTRGSAHAGFAEDEVGTLEPGKLADLVVLEGDILSVDPREIGEILVDMTILDGKVVFERER